MRPKGFQVFSSLLIAACVLSYGEPTPACRHLLDDIAGPVDTVEIANGKAAPKRSVKRSHRRSGKTQSSAQPAELSGEDLLIKHNSPIAGTCPGCN